MRADAARLPQDHSAIGSLVVSHEAALLAFARLELAGHGERSLRPVRELIEAEGAA
jgi:hypothetical protein